MNQIIKVQNLKCNGCAHTIRTTLEIIDGVTVNNIIPEDDSIDIDLTSITLLDIVKAILKDKGYPPLGGQNSLGTQAKSFVSCAIGKFNK